MREKVEGSHGHGHAVTVKGSERVWKLEDIIGSRKKQFDSSV